MSSLLLRNAEVLIGLGPAARLERLDVRIEEGRIKELGFLLPSKKTEEKSLDFKGCVILPGLIDTQTHMREPGLEHKEDLQTGSRAAVAGGITGVFEMPNTKPPTTDAEQLQNKMNRAEGRMHCHYAFYVGATAENASELGRLETLPGCCGTKIFMGSSTGNLLVSEDENLRRVLASTHRRAAIHAEDQNRLVERKKITEAPGATVAAHPEWRDERCGLIAVERIVGMARELNKPIHILHISSQEEMAFLKTVPKPQISVEILPQYLLLSAPECYERLGTLAQMNPPIRNHRHLEYLWAAVLDGTVDIMGSDHAPHTLAEKDQPYPLSPSGMPGVQTMAPLMLDCVSKGKLTLPRLVELLCWKPIELFGIRNRGQIKAGFDADLSIFDLKKSWRIDNDWIESRCGWSPFNGMKIKGQPRATIVGGHIAMLDGKIDDHAHGKPISFERPQ